MPALRRVLAECRAGVRRWPDTDYGETYVQSIARFGENAPPDPDPWERTLGDLVDPTRPGSLTSLVNVVCREVSADVDGWRIDRLMNMVATVAQENRARDTPEI